MLFTAMISLLIGLQGLSNVAALPRSNAPGSAQGPSRTERDSRAKEWPASASPLRLRSKGMSNADRIKRGLPLKKPAPVHAKRLMTSPVPGQSSDGEYVSSGLCYLSVTTGVNSESHIIFAANDQAAVNQCAQYADANSAPHFLLSYSSDGNYYVCYSDDTAGYKQQKCTLFNIIQYNMAP